MFLNESSFSNFITNKKTRSIYLQTFVLSLIFAFVTNAWCAQNVFLSFFLFSDFFVFSFVIFTIIAIRSDDENAFNKWRDKIAKEELMKEKLRLIYFLFGIFLFIIILFMILLSNLISDALLNPLDIENSLLIFILLILELLLTKPLFYWLINTQFEIGIYSEFNNLISVELNSGLFFVKIFVFFMVMVATDLLVITYYTRGTPINSPFYITLILLLQIIFVLVIYLFVIRRGTKKINLEQV